jgi:hypothetical protein
VNRSLHTYSPSTRPVQLLLTVYKLHVLTLLVVNDLLQKLYRFVLSDICWLFLVSLFWMLVSGSDIGIGC